LKRKGLIIAIDGPAGAGKSTIAGIVAKELGYFYIDTGAMFRAIAWKAHKEKLNLHDPKALARLAGRTSLEFRRGRRNQNLRIFMDGEDVSNKIRTERVSFHTNEVAKVKGVRKILRERQRKIGRGGGVVMEGRDIGTRVFPNAEIKFYLDASPSERARRRHGELRANGKRVSLERIAHALAQRDYKDKNRGISPLRQARDAIVIDSTRMSLREVARSILAHVKGRPFAPFL
jgi:cytidylate kinase